MRIENNFCVFDVETGGLSPLKNPMTEITLTFLNCDLGEIESYTTYIQGYDGLEYNQKALDITGITMENIASGKTIAEVVSDIVGLFKKHKAGRKKTILIGHNVAFDIGFLKYAFQNHSNEDMYKYVEEVPLDTWKLSQLAYGADEEEMENFKLGTCCERAGIVLTDGHRSANDVEATAKLFVALVGLMRGNAEGTVGGSVKRKRTFKF